MTGPLGTAAFGEPFTGPDYATPNPFDAYLSDVNAQLIYLVELYPYDASLPQTMRYPLAYGVGAFGETDVTYWGGVAPVYLSDMGFTTTPTDTPPSTYFIAQVDNPVQIETSILSGNGFGSGSQSFGSISIANGDGRLDYLENYGWAGRRAVVKAGIPGFAYSQFATVFDGAVNSTESDEERITLTIRDNRFKVDQLLLPPVYAGTGGLEGGSDLAGKVRPLCYGMVNNIEPVLVDAANLIYQLHDGAIQWVDEVRDNGVALGNGGDVADITTATVLAGTFKTSLDKGYIKLGSTPAGRITADARGEIRNGYVSSAGDIARRIVTTRLGALSLLETDVDSGSLAAMNSKVGGSVGIYLNERTTAASVLDDLIAPLGAYWTFNRQGQLFAGVVDAPAGPTMTITADLIEEGGLRVADTITPAWRLSVGYAPAFVVQAESELAGATDAIDRAFVTQEYRYVTAQDEAVRAQNKQAVERTFLTRLANKSAAQALLARLQSLYSVQRRVYRVSLHRSLFRLYIGNTVRLVYDRFGLSAGVNLLVIGISEDAETGLTTLDLWG